MNMGPKDAIDLSQVRRVLVVKLRHHGDVLLTTPVFTSLKRVAPEIEIDALVYADTAVMLEGNPAVRGIFSVGRDWRSLSPVRRIAREWALFGSLRDRNYDLLLHLSEHPRGAWLARLLGCGYSVAPDYGGRSKFWRRSFSHRYSLAKNARRHMVEWNLDVLRRIGIYPNDEDRALVLVPGEEAEVEAGRILAENGVQGSFIHLHPTSRWPFKCWTPERNTALIDQLSRRGERVVVTASPDSWEMSYVKSVISGCSVKPIDLSGKLTLKGLAALTARAKLFIGVDSAPMHIAAAMGTPVVALFGPSGEAEWGPWGKKVRVVASLAHACRPCGVDGCGGGKRSECLTTLPESRVMAAIDELGIA